MILGIETHNIQHPILRAAAMNENPITRQRPRGTKKGER
jgi:hypothetical protein